MKNEKLDCPKCGTILKNGNCELCTTLKALKVKENEIISIIEEESHNNVLFEKTEQLFLDYGEIITKMYKLTNK